jgi:hypothetical protein
MFILVNELRYAAKLHSFTLISHTTKKKPKSFLALKTIYFLFEKTIQEKQYKYTNRLARKVSGLMPVLKPEPRAPV